MQRNVAYCNGADKMRSKAQVAIRRVSYFAINLTSARDLLYKYFGQLELLELRFSEIKVPFVW